MNAKTQSQAESFSFELGRASEYCKTYSLAKDFGKTLFCSQNEKITLRG